MPFGPEPRMACRQHLIVLCCWCLVHCGTSHSSDLPGMRSIAFPSSELHQFRSTAAPDGYFHARIPAVVLAHDTTLVAVAECARCVKGCGNYVGWSADICSKRSVDDGLTWHNFTVVQVDGSQPNFVFDRTTNTLVLNFNLHRTGDWPHGGKNMQTTSTDGVTWSKPVELPAALGLTAAESGPGAALHLSNGPHKGRLLFSGWRNQRLGTTNGEVLLACLLNALACHRACRRKLIFCVTGGVAFG